MVVNELNYSDKYINGILSEVKTIAVVFFK